MLNKDDLLYSTKKPQPKFEADLFFKQKTWDAVDDLINKKFGRFVPFKRNNLTSKELECAEVAMKEILESDWHSAS